MRETPISETYEEYQNLIYFEVLDFFKKHGGDVDEMVSEANLVFMKVYETYDPARGEFSTLLTISVYRKLIDMLYNRCEHKRRWGVSLDAEYNEMGPLSAQVEDHHRDWNLKDFAEGLTEDGRIVLGLVMEAPAEIAEIATSKGGEPRNWRSTIRNYLYAIGWSADRIAASFQQIAGALA